MKYKGKSFKVLLFVYLLSLIVFTKFSSVCDDPVVPDVDLIANLKIVQDYFSI